jgi:tRNA pseudouridine38-40 synthase
VTEPGATLIGDAGLDSVPRETQRVRLDIAYDGTDFSGWAAQPGRRTVAGVLMEQLDRVFRDRDGAFGPTGLTVAGRTDAGVHATGQVAHVDVAAAAWSRTGPTLIRRLSGLLPPDVRVTDATAVPKAFDARFSALWRRYEYRVGTEPYGVSPLRARDTLAWPRPLDVEAMKAAAQGLVGTHDFAAFCRRKEHATTVRAVMRCDWRIDPDGILVATVQADAFCWSMVRSLVGAMIAVGEGRRAESWPHALLSRAERAGDVVVAPAHGLTLVQVAYPQSEAALGERSAITRNRRDNGPA